MPYLWWQSFLNLRGRTPYSGNGSNSNKVASNSLPIIDPSYYKWLRDSFYIYVFLSHNTCRYHLVITIAQLPYWLLEMGLRLLLLVGLTLPSCNHQSLPQFLRFLDPQSPKADILFPLLNVRRELQWLHHLHKQQGKLCVSLGEV